MTGKMRSARRMGVLCVMMLLMAGGNAVFAQHEEGGDEGHGEESKSRFSDEPIPLADIPKRPGPLIELGEPFLGTGTLKQGIRLPTGAVWQPAFLAFGTVRSGVQGFAVRPGEFELAEAAARFDLFGNLYLTQTERVLIGFRPLDQNGAFTRLTLHSNPDIEEDFEDELNFGIRTLFFEGDLAEIFPKFDWDDSNGLDYYISVGRQPISFQDGLLINEDAIDMVGLTRSNMKIGGLINVRATGIFAWGDIDRPTGGANLGDKSALLWGLFTETDVRKRTIEIDAIFVAADELRGDGLYVGVGSTRRIGQINNTFRVVASFPIGDETVFNQQGTLAINQIAWTPHHTHNWVYINAFIGADNFRSAARAPTAGGPLGNAGILFAAVGLGRFPSGLGNLADQAVGGSVGYQIFFDHTRKQLLLEAGGRFTYDEDAPGADAFAAGARYQMAVGRRGVIVLDGFGAYNLDAEDLFVGGRLEFVLKL